jgi:hypothetical protein
LPDVFWVRCFCFHDSTSSQFLPLFRFNLSLF